MESHDIWIYGLIPASFITVFGLKKIQHKEHIEKKIKVTAICLFLTLSLITSYIHFLAGLSLSYFATSIILNLFVITIFMIPALIVFLYFDIKNDNLIYTEVKDIPLQKLKKYKLQLYSHFATKGISATLKCTRVKS